MNKIGYLCIIPLFIPACANAQTAVTWVDNFNQSRSSAIAEEARPFIIKRQGCDHFRGEPAYDEERREFLVQKIKELCTGTDAELIGLRAKFADKPETIAALAEFEDCIEFDSKCPAKTPNDCEE